MTNKEIYKRTLTFSVRRLLFDLLAFLALGALSAAGFFIMDKVNNKGLIGLGIGFLIGIIALAIFLRYVSYKYKAGQIAMMTKGVTENALPDDVLGEGKRIVKERFATVAAYFAVTRIIKAIFNQLSRGLTAVGNAIGGDKGGTVGSVIGSGVQTVVGYLCDCCLGWVFYRKDQKSTKAMCEGAVLFFKHGKTFLKNVGRIFGMSLLFLIVIGGAFFGLFFGIFSMFPKAFTVLTAEIGEAAVRLGKELPAFMSDPKYVMMIAAGIAALIVWGIIHSAFVRPFVLVGVLRNYMESGVNDVPTEESFAMLDGKSAKFRKLRTEGDL